MGKNNKNKAQRNEGFKSDAQIIFEGKQLLEKRPENMDSDTYKFLRKTQSLLLKHLFHKGHSPSRKLSGLMGQKQPPIARTAKGSRRIIKQRKAS
jgi:hypothetical protein